MKTTQEEKFIVKEGDAWFERNKPGQLKPITKEHNIIKGMISSNLPNAGSLIDLGGGVGSVAAGIMKFFPGWEATVLEPSRKAINAGKNAFPKINYNCGSLTKEADLPNKEFDLAIISMVFSWIDRSLLSRAISNIDNLIKPGGHIIIQDFYTPIPKANKYHYDEEMYTFKQDYSLPFKALNIYSEIYSKAEETDHTQFDENDLYDTWLVTSILLKDLKGRYT